jgi:prepilin peptidase CpaA
VWSNYLLIILLSICVITDIKERKIYNAVLFPFLIISLFFHAINGGWHGLTEAFLGTAVGLGILFIPYLSGGMGAGDVKLLAVIGGLKGISFVLMASLYMALAGGIMAIIFLLYRKGLLKRFLYMIHGLRHGMRLSLIEDSNTMKTTLPYGVAIAAGAIYQAYFPGVFSL